MIAVLKSNRPFRYFEPSTRRSNCTVEARMIRHRDITEILPVEDCAPKNIKLAHKVQPFHTDSLTYSQRERGVYHDRSDCVHGQRIKQEGNAVPGTDERDSCNRCADLDAGIDDFFPGDDGG
jgi:hypothetical protein